MILRRSDDVSRKRTNLVFETSLPRYWKIPRSVRQGSTKGKKGAFMLQVVDISFDGESKPVVQLECFNAKNLINHLALIPAQAPRTVRNCLYSFYMRKHKPPGSGFVPYLKNVRVMNISIPSNLVICDIIQMAHK